VSILFDEAMYFEIRSELLLGKQATILSIELKYMNFLVEAVASAAPRIHGLSTSTHSAAHMSA
jgi:hypothetical protein